MGEAPSSARRAALLALQRWRKESHLADMVLCQVLDGAALKPSDRAFTQELFYGLLRHLRRIDFWIDQLRSSPLQADLRDVVRLGCHQLFILGVPEHAAVYETVQLAAPRHRGLINAILRSAIRRWPELEKLTASQSRAIQMSHPDFLVARWEKAFGEADTTTLCAWDNQPPPLYARINTLKINEEGFLAKYEDASPLPGQAGFVQFQSSLPHTALQAGECYIQDPSTALACRLLAPEKGETLIDACAAPGGKASLLAAFMGNEGTIIACDRQPDRLDRLRENLRRLGAGNARVVNHDWLSGTALFDQLQLGQVDRILVDAPCSNTGVMRRRVDVRWRIHPGEFQRMQKQQIAIVRSASQHLKKNGILVYSTCSLEREENEEVVEALLNEVPLRLEETKRSLPFRDGFDGAYAARLIKEG